MAAKRRRPEPVVPFGPGSAAAIVKVREHHRPPTRAGRERGVLIELVLTDGVDTEALRPVSPSTLKSYAAVVRLALEAGLLDLPWAERLGREPRARWWAALVREARSRCELVGLSMPAGATEKRP